MPAHGGGCPSTRQHPTAPTTCQHPPSALEGPTKHPPTHPPTHPPASPAHPPEGRAAAWRAPAQCLPQGLPAGAVPGAPLDPSPSCCSQFGKPVGAGGEGPAQGGAGGVGGRVAGSGARTQRQARWRKAPAFAAAPRLEKQAQASTHQASVTLTCRIRPLFSFLPWAAILQGRRRGQAAEGAESGCRQKNSNAAWRRAGGPAQPATGPHHTAPSAVFLPRRSCDQNILPELAFLRVGLRGGLHAGGWGGCWTTGGGLPRVARGCWQPSKQLRGRGRTEWQQSKRAVAAAELLVVRATQKAREQSAAEEYRAPA